MTGGMIVRLIDVVLIILFGFIAISDIQLKRQIKMPGPPDEKNQPKQETSRLLFVRIDKAGKLTLRMDDTDLATESETTALSHTLGRVIKEIRLEGQIPVVIIDPEPDASMQRTIDVFDLCEQLGVAKSINVAPKTRSG
jgi:biopolymer transport protein ExbD